MEPERDGAEEAWTAPDRRELVRGVVMLTPEELAAERARRGLPGYARPVEAPKAFPITPAPAPAAWWFCVKCEEEYPSTEFNWAGNAHPKRKVCNACYKARYGKKRRTACSGCGKEVSTRVGVEAPMCRPCQKDAREADAREPTWDRRTLKLFARLDGIAEAQKEAA